ncbi:hypothetical protein [Nonomuraea sediminis]|uniref:hypothetical protein n=1 Tax=Nonomuraea sediminis TaxID=2835864 RepID=UPI00202A4D65|nr:hypothetical protein [Nonomuraea sediminis]
MALVMAVMAMLSQRISATFGVGRSVALGLALMGVAIYMLSGVGASGTYGDVLPWFLLYGVGGGMLVSLTAVTLNGMPAGRSGIASGVLNVSREVFGLLGITVLGAILSGRQSASHQPPLIAFLDAYQFTLVIAAVIVLLGIPVAIVTLRASRTPARSAEEELPAPAPVA